MRNMLLCLGLFLAALPLTAQSGRMTVKRLGRILEQHCENLEGRPGLWQADFASRGIIIVTDAAANRMRIFTPVELEANLKEAQLRLMLRANFHTALDAKYGLYEGYVVSIFMHPLRELSEEQVVDALQQVVHLADTFGTTYSSKDLLFGGDTPTPAAIPSPRKRITRS